MEYNYYPEIMGSCEFCGNPTRYYINDDKPICSICLLNLIDDAMIINDEVRDFVKRAGYNAKLEDYVEERKSK